MSDHRFGLATERLLAHDVHELPLTRPSQPGLWVEGGWPTAAAEPLAELDGVAVSVWEMTAGVVLDVERDEVIVVISGSGWIRFDDGESTAIRPGLCLQLRAGERAEWTVTDRLRIVAIDVRQDLSGFTQPKELPHE